MTVAPTLTNPEWLYRSWQLTQVVTDGQTLSPQGYVGTATFRSDGTFGDAQPGAVGYGCCEPVAFELKNSVIKFIWFQSGPGCAKINCISSPLSAETIWQITTLTETSLVLTAGKNKLTFERKP